MTDDTREIVGPTIDWDSVGYSLREHMDENALSVRDLQKKIGVDKATLSRICRGKRCTPEAYIAVCVEMGTRPTYFFAAQEGRND